MRMLAWLLLMLPLGGLAQGYLGLNLGPAYGRTLDAQFYLYPKNEDWIAASVSGGYSFSGRTYFARKKKECIGNLRSGGWHLRAGVRNDLTTQNHSSHLYWELLMVYTRHQESGVTGTCDTTGASLREIEQTGSLLSGALRIGYTWNPLHKKTIYQKILVDFGLQLGVPFWSNLELISERNHYSGIGYTWLPFRSVAIEPTITLRWKLNQRRYGFFKGQERKRFK